MISGWLCCCCSYSEADAAAAPTLINQGTPSDTGTEVTAAISGSQASGSGSMPRPMTSLVYEARLVSLGWSRRREFIYDIVPLGEAGPARHMLEGPRGTKWARVRDRHGVTALCTAAEGNHVSLMELLLDKGAIAPRLNYDGKNALFWASEAGSLEAAQLLVRRGVDVNTRCSDLSTALMSASSNGHTAVVLYLIERGRAIVDVVEQRGYTALFYACENGHLETARVLVEHHASVNASFYYDTSVLMVTAYNGHKHVVKYLIQCGANVNFQTLFTYVTALHVACLSGHFEVVQILIEDGQADVNIVDMKYTSSLMVASRHGYFAIVRYLVASGAHVHIQNERGHTAEVIAHLSCHTDIEDYLHSCGALY